MGLEKCLLRWKRFFEKIGPDGLTEGMQRGLFAELNWLNRLMAYGIKASDAIGAWKGCERSFHDFDLKSHVVEVKSTRTKEPKNVTISSEKQLDDRGLKSLSLYVLSVNEVEAGGLSLPGLVKTLQMVISDSPSAQVAFRDKLLSAGYMPQDEHRYLTQYSIISEDFYKVVDGFPRIISTPSGIGDLRYRLFLSACTQFQFDILGYLNSLTR
jgi:hypothetical protein